MVRRAIHSPATTLSKIKLQECVVKIDACRLERKRIEEPQQTHHLHFADRADVVDVNINKDFERHAY